MSAHSSAPTEPGTPGNPTATRPAVRGGAIALAVVGLVIGMAIGYAVAASHSRATIDELARVRQDLETLSSAHETLQERNGILYLEAERLRSARETRTARLREPGVFTDGIYEVGEDIEPGTYDGTVAAEAGYWARLKSTTGMLSSIITNDVVRGPFVLTINTADAAVELRGVTLTARR